MSDLVFIAFPSEQKAEEVRDLEVHLLFQLAPHGVQPVHRPVAGVVADLAEPVDVHVAAHPLRRRQLR